MKPDGVVTAAMEPMDPLESNPDHEAGPAVGPQANQAASPVVETVPQYQAGDSAPVAPQPDQQPKETPPAKTANKISGDSKTKTANKTTAKTKPAGPTKTTTGPRPNGVSKPQTNGVTKRTTPPVDKKTTSTSAVSKKPTGTTVPPAKSKVGEKKPTGASPATNVTKTSTGPTKKTPSATANGVKANAPAAAAARKTPVSKPAPTRPSSAAAPKTPVTKTPRPTTGTAAPSPRPATGSTRQPTPTAAKSSSATAKPATPKTPSTTSRPPASKSTSSTPSAGKATTSQTSRTPTPMKKDVTIPAATTVKKSTESPRPAAKSAKPETPKPASKSEVTTKKPTATKAADTKTPTRPKTQETKATPSKTPGTKAKATSPKKTVGSSTPTPVKRGPKAATFTESAKEGSAAVAATAAVATAAVAAAAARPEEPEPPAVAVAEEIKAEPVSTPVLDAVPETTEPTPKPILEITPELKTLPVREPSPELLREPTPEPMREPSPEPLREPSPEPMSKPSPGPLREPMREPSPEPLREPTPEPMREPSPEPLREPTPEPLREAELGAASAHEPPYNVHPSAEMDLFKFEEPANESVTSLGTTVMSPPCSPPGPVSPVREQQNANSWMDMKIQSNPWDSSDITPQSTANRMTFETEQEKKNKEYFAHETREEEEEEDDEEEEENLVMPTSTAAPAGAFSMMAGTHFLGTSPMDDHTPTDLISPNEKEEAVEKADEEINEDDEEEDDDDEDEEQRRLGHQPSSMITDTSMSQPSEEFQVRSPALGGSTGWHGDDLLSGMDSEDVSSCTSSRQQGVSDLSSTLHTAILEGTQSSDALVDSSLRGSEGDGNLMGSPNVETLANEEEDDEDEEDERVDDMDLSSERVEEQHKAFQQQGHDEEDDEDVEMRSEGVTESCGNVDEDDFNEEEHLDNLNRSVPPPCVPPATSWGQTNPFADTWGQPAGLLNVSSPSPVSDHGAAESETPTQSPAQTRLETSAPCFVPHFEQELQDHQFTHEDMKDSTPEKDDAQLAASAVGRSRGGSETSTPEDLRDYDSSSGVESRSDKQQTPVPASSQPDMDQDLGIHLEKGDGEEEEAETLPADEVLGTGPPTAPASAPSSPSSSGDEASDTEGEIQINDPDAPIMMDDSGGFESPTPNPNLAALEEDEEATDMPAGDGEEDGGGATPQSANSVASYGFDTSNAHSMAESCGKSPGIFSLENEEHLSEEAKDPSLIKELTLTSAAATAQAGDTLGRPVDLMPLGGLGNQPGGDHHLYMFGGKVGADHLEEVDPLESRHHLEAQESDDEDDGDDGQPPYYSTVCDKTDSFLAGDVDGDHELQAHSKEDNQNQNQTTMGPTANAHYLAFVPGNRRPIDLTLAEHFAKIAPPPPLLDEGEEDHPGGEQLKRLEQHQQKLKEMQERQRRQWLEVEELREEPQNQLELQRRELLQLQLQKQQQEHRHRRQVLQWQLELEQQYRMQQQLRRSPTGVMLSPSSGLCTIYEAMETSEEEEEGDEGEQKMAPSSEPGDRQPPSQEVEWNQKVDMVQQLINQTLMLSGDRGCPPLLLLPVGSGGTLSPLESTMWPTMLPQFQPPVATVTSVSSYCPDSRGSSPPGDWTVVEVETQH